MIETIEGGHLTTPKGFLAGATSAGFYASGPKKGGLDLCILYSEQPCATAGVFTQNLIKGAPVLVSAEHVATGRVRAIVANSGCSNSLNGPGGYDDAKEMAALAAKQLGLASEEVAVCSTGVTGVRMPMDKLRAGVPQLKLDATSGPAIARHPGTGQYRRQPLQLLAS